MLQGNLKISFANPRFVYGDRAGRMLRGTLTLAFSSPSGEDQGTISTEGCLIARDTTGRLCFNTPLNTFGKGGRRLTQISPALEDRIIEAVKRSGYAELIGVEIQAEKSQVDPKSFGIKEDSLEVI